MKIKLLIISLISWAVILQAQESPNLITKNEHVKKDFYHESLGTKGLLLTFEYLYKNTKERLSLQYPTVTLHQNGANIYYEQQTVLPLQTNTWSKAEIFIPYRKISLFKGTQENVILTVKLDNGWNYTTTINYEQPLRFKVDIQLTKGAVKEQLLPYDKQVSAKEWLPDPYFTFTTNGGTIPLFQSKVNFNQYQLPTSAISLYLLEGEQLQWSFYDRDGAEDELLGIYNEFESEGTIYEDYYGMMFGAIKDLDFIYARKAQVPQAINLYSNASYKHEGKEGVVFIVKYELPEPFVGQKVKPVFDFYDKNGIRLDIPILYPLKEAVELGQEMTLQKRGQLHYFVPFYVWKEICHAVEFSFLREDGERIQAAPYFLNQTIKFDDWILAADLNVKENTTFKGAKGIELQVAYELSEMYDNAPLYLKFYRPDNTVLPFKLYAITGKNKAIAINREHKINTPKVADKLSYFIPYNVLKDGAIAVRAELVPDVTMMLFEKFTPVLNGRGETNDVPINIVKAEERFRSGNYGKLVHLKVDVPTLYRSTSQLYLEVRENGTSSKNILVEGAEQQGKYYKITNDSGHVYVAIPYRKISPNAKFNINAYIWDTQQEQQIGEPIAWDWVAPQQLFNSKIDVELVACKFDKQVIKNAASNEDFPWEYVVQAGNDVVIKEALSPSFTRDKERFNKSIQVNREDNITIQLLNTKTKRGFEIWKGDLSKWEQSNFKTVLKNQHPIKMLQVVAKVPQDYNAHTPR